jgi:PASTA domain
MEGFPMRRYAAVGLALVFVLTVVACTDTPAPTSKGNRAVGVEAEEADEAKPAPDTEKGIVPKLIGVSVGDAKQAIADAGFTVGAVETLGLFGTPTNTWVVCEQQPVGGQSPREGAKVDLTADRAC